MGLDFLKRKLARREMQTVLFRFWTCVAYFISNDDHRNAKNDILFHLLHMCALQSFSSIFHIQ